MFKKITATLLVLALATLCAPVSIAQGEVDIKSVEFDEYYAIDGNVNKKMVSVSVDYSVPAGTKSASLLLLGKDITSPAELEAKTIYIDQIDNPTGTYDFVIEKSRIASALGVDNIEGTTLYLKMGASGVNTPDLEEVTYISPAPLTFDGSSVRTSGTQGLRYTFSISKDLFEKLEKPEGYDSDGLGFGSVVMPKRYLGDTKLEKGTVTTVNGKEYAAKTVPAVKLYKETEYAVWYTVVITGITPNNYTEEYVAVPYITYLDGETETTIYGTQTEDVTVYSIAQLAYADETESSDVKDYLYNNILNVVDPSKYPKK